MPKAILAIRSYPATLLLALFLFVATLVVTTGSLGKVGAGAGGGDSGDGGSGIGGTGRSGEFGGSGFGGTGGPSPFFTSVEDEDSATESAVFIPAESAVVESSTELAAETTDSLTAEIEDSLNNVIEEIVEQHPLVDESQIILASDSADTEDAPVATTAEPPRPTQTLPLQIVEAVQLESPVAREPTQLTESDPTSVQTVQFSTVAESAIEVEHGIATEVQQTEVQQTDVPQVAETLPVNLETAAEPEDGEIERRSLPDRIQRPELPPFQRIRPVERAAIMPPRVQPMRI